VAGPPRGPVTQSPTTPYLKACGPPAFVAMFPPICDCSGAPGSGREHEAALPHELLEPTGRDSGLDVDPPELGARTTGRDRAGPVPARPHRPGRRLPPAPVPPPTRDDRHLPLVAPRRARQRPPRPSARSTTASARPGARCEVGEVLGRAAPRAPTRRTPVGGRRSPEELHDSATQPARRRPPGRSGPRARRAPGQRAGNPARDGLGDLGPEDRVESPNRTSAGLLHDPSASRIAISGAVFGCSGSVGHQLGNASTPAFDSGVANGASYAATTSSSSPRTAAVRISRPGWKSPSGCPHRTSREPKPTSRSADGRRRRRCSGSRARRPDRAARPRAAARSAPPQSWTTTG
jgi:hypothetical protein